MTKKWTNNILTKTFDEKAASASENDKRIPILSAVKPIAAFFEKLGFEESESPNVAAHRWVTSKIRLNLMATPEKQPDAAADQFDAITIAINMQLSGTVIEQEPLSLRVSANENGGGKYELIENGHTTMVSGAPRKIAEEFVRQSTGDIHQVLITYARLRDRAEQKPLQGKWEP